MAEVLCALPIFFISHRAYIYRVTDAEMGNKARGQLYDGFEPGDDEFLGYHMGFLDKQG